MTRKIIYGYLLLFITSIIIFYPKNTLAQPGSIWDAAPPKEADAKSSPLVGDCIDTAIGCVPIDTEAFAVFILRWGIGIGGGIAFLLMTFAGFQILTSQGNPDKLKAGQELLTAALSGLLLLIFAATILRIVGVDLFGIPGLS